MQMENTRKQFLFLDQGRGGYLKEAHLTASEVKVIVEDELLNEGNIFRASNIILLSNAQKYDLVVLGHSDEFGLRKARAVAGTLRKRTIIVSDEPLSSEVQKQYEDMGYRKFLSRVELAMVIRRELGLE